METLQLNPILRGWPTFCVEYRIGPIELNMFFPTSEVEQST